MFKVSDLLLLSQQKILVSLKSSRYFLLLHQYDNRLSFEHFWKMGFNSPKIRNLRKNLMLRGMYANIPKAMIMTTM